jgi:4-amino-4-deoxy-L-arabinose transferase-like glycosyltransferase
MNNHDNLSKLNRLSLLTSWMRIHKLDLAIVVLLLAVSVTVSGVNMADYPQRFEDEGTYISQAWAFKEKGELAHYTYWYDHPPAGWIQIAGHQLFTNALERYGSAVAGGREFMLLLHLATIVLLFALARRLSIGSVAAGLGVLTYGLSPLAVEFSRYVMLDNVALPWLLAAFLLALSPSRHLVTAIGAALCMAIAILSKETFLILLPVLMYALWGNGDQRNRRYQMAAFGVVFVMISGLYILYAALKKELFPGDGHVSLLGTIYWQLFGREGSGSILATDSGSRGLLNYWLNLDPFLLLAGVISLPFTFIYRKLHVVALALLISLALMLRSGYLPFPYVIVLLPFSTLVFAGVLHNVVIVPLKARVSLIRRFISGAVAVLLTVVAIGLVAPDWQAKLYALNTVDQDESSRETVDWIAENVSRDNLLIVESALWTDLVQQGFDQPEPVWLYKTETDPEVAKEIGSWQNIDYVILNGSTVGDAGFSNAFPTVSQAIDNAELVGEFGQDNQKLLIYKVNSPAERNVISTQNKGGE